MSEHDEGSDERQRSARRASFDRGMDRRGSKRFADRGPVVGRRTLIESVAGGAPAALEAVVGKRTAVEELQARMTLAASGVASATTKLPHEDVIQRLFGRHDIEGTQAAIGGPAAEAAGALDATAYTHGDRVGFATTPDLRTAAHEAAHVVQQRHGRAPADGIDTAGDALEQHADAVADRVVAGESAEPLLDRLQGGAGPTEAIQRERGGAGPTDAIQRERKAQGEAPAGPAGYDPEVDTHSVGELFARSLGDAVLEQTIEILSQRRHRADLAPMDRDMASANLEILAAEADRRGRPSPALDRDAARTLIRDATTGAAQLAGMLQQLAASRDGLRNHPVTERFVENAVDRVTWLVDTIGAGRSYLELSAGTGGEAGAALLAMAVTRAQAAQVGLAVLRPWCAYLQIHDRVAMLPLLQLEHRYRTLDAQQRGVDAVFAQLAGLDPGALTLASAGIPGRVAALATAFDALLADCEHAEAVQRWAMLAQIVAEMVAFAGSLRAFFTLGGPPAAVAFPMPAIAGSGGAAALSQVVVSAEWIAAIRHLVQIGAISAASAAEALRVRGFTSAMAQATDLPQPVKDLLGDGPTADAMKVTNSTGAGVARPPRHHVLPQERRAFFEQRGFTGDLDIDNFTVELEVAEHQAQHGGGDWKEGRKWPGEWNRLVMDRLEEREQPLGRRLTIAEIMREVERLMARRDIPLRFVPYRGE